MAPASQEQWVQVGPHRLKLSNLDKVLYPATGTTKGEVLAYYSAVSGVQLAHLTGRPVTRKRLPEGVGGPEFFEKNLPKGTPDWVRRVRLPVPGSTKDRETILYPLVEDLPTLVWLANLAALELHTPQWVVRADPELEDPQSQSQSQSQFQSQSQATVAVRSALPPNRLVIDLDPGPGAGLAACAEVAFAVRDRLLVHGVEPIPVTSGGKGMQLYAPLRGDQDGEAVVGFARSLALGLEQAMPALVVSRMTKALRPGRVLLDWSQNTPAKTTIAPYSLRGRDLPTAAAPRSWAELAAGDLAQLDHAEVLTRLATDGDLLAPLLTAGTDAAPRLP